MAPWFFTSPRSRRLAVLWQWSGTATSVKLDVENRRLDLLVSEAELRSRMEAWCPAHKKYRRGYYTMFLDHILQADKGCDFDFLVGQPDEEPYEPVVGRS